jgi:hypothetical protein
MANKFWPLYNILSSAVHSELYILTYKFLFISFYLNGILHSKKAMSGPAELRHTKRMQKIERRTRVEIFLPPRYLVCSTSVDHVGIWRIPDRLFTVCVLQ